jgi:uncharacterized membrane protein YfcA
MKNRIVLLFSMLMLLPGVNSVQAAGGGPPKNILKGVFTQVDSAKGQASFQPDDREAIRILKIGAGVKAQDIPIDQKVMVSLDTKAGPDVIKDVSIMFLNMTLGKVFSLLIIGLIGGLLSGFIGSGGAFVLTPSMMSLGVPGAVAVASNMCHKFPKALVGAFKRYKYGQVDIKLGAVMALSAIVGVQIGVQIQKYILNSWGNAGSNLYVSTIFVFVLVVVGGYVSSDAYKLAKGKGQEKTSKLALALQKIELWPMMEFKVAKVRISAWITIPIGLLTGMLAATIAVGGFIGVPGMIYVVGTSALVASATELVIAFIMGFWGSIQWGISGLIDIRMTLLILAGSLIGVQLGALGTTYVKDYMIKVVMAAVMLIVAVSRGAKIPGYLADLNLIPLLNTKLELALNTISFWALVAALATAGVIITIAMVRGMLKAKAEAAGEPAQHSA